MIAYKHTKIWVCWLFLAPLLLSAQNYTTLRPKENAGPLRNPYKGWNTKWYDTPQPKYSSISALSLLWKDFEIREGVYDWEKMDKLMNDHGSAGSYININMFSDKLKASNNAPDYVYKKVKKYSTTYKGAKYTITDCNDSYYLNNVINFLEAFYKRYKDNKRIHSFNLGFLGFYGEWSKWPFKSDQFSIKESSKIKLLEGFLDKRTVGFVGARYTHEKLFKKFEGQALSFSDGYFRPDHKHQKQFVDNMGNYWKYGPIGGETPPDITDKDWNNMFNTGIGEKVIRKGYYSNMKGAFGHTEDNKYKNGFDKLARLMGYNFAMQEVRYPKQMENNKNVTVTIKGKNKGAAPFYYDWDVQLGLLRTSITNVKSQTIEAERGKRSGKTSISSGAVKFSGNNASLSITTNDMATAGDYIFDIDYRTLGFWFFDVYVNSKKVVSSRRVSPNVKSSSDKTWTPFRLALPLQKGKNEVRFEAVRNFEGSLLFDKITYRTGHQSFEEQVITLQSADVRKWMPGQGFSVSSPIKVNVPKGEYQLAARIIYKDASQRGSKNWHDLDPRNAHIVFANSVSTVDGYWGSDNLFHGGWALLDKVSVGGTPAPNPTPVPVPPTTTDILSDGLYQLSSPQNGQQLVSYSKEQHNAVVKNSSDKSEHVWYIKHLGDGVYTLQNQATKRYLEVPNAVCGNGRNVATWTNARDAHKRWKIVKIDSAYTLHPLHCPETALDRRKGASNANVQIWKSYSNGNQLWKITPTRGKKNEIDQGKGIQLYPNPVQHLLTIENVVSESEIVIYNSLGQKVAIYPTVSDRIEISVQDLAPGLYYIKNGVEKTLRFIKE